MMNFTDQSARRPLRWEGGQRDRRAKSRVSETYTEIHGGGLGSQGWKHWLLHTARHRTISSWQLGPSFFLVSFCFLLLFYPVLAPGPSEFKGKMRSAIKGPWAFFFVVCTYMQATNTARLAAKPSHFESRGRSLGNLGVKRGERAH
ncbi:hypothetical protein LZ32DRAFT_85237 [Colletotrichum eremochloae]|nr:hypothetical protein LZ32DRAFT_85237 [Colletotrichum eremochloae]